MWTNHFMALQLTLARAHRMGNLVSVRTGRSLLGARSGGPMRPKHAVQLELGERHLAGTIGDHAM
jgi:hypothetical protein